MVYSPAEDQRLWKGKAVETGLKSRWMEDQLIVYQVVAGSPGEKAGVKLGDRVVSIDGEEVQNADHPSVRSGNYEIDRNGKLLLLKIEAGELKIDERPSLRDLGGGTALITLSSFRAEYFQENEWKEFVGKWKKYSRLIFDLRENAGGNMASMLRALSPLFCKRTHIGEMFQPRKEEKASFELEDNLSDDDQIAQMDRARHVSLVTFEGYGCYTGAVGLLIGPHTSSVSEIFASAVLARPHSRVFGQPSAGDVVLAIWYDLPSLGRGFTISIPEALFLTPSKKKLEGEGVHPQQEVFDDLKVWRRGQDSWIRSALISNF
jgi:carboxyl-terminal processing protease